MSEEDDILSTVSQDQLAASSQELHPGQEIDGYVIDKELGRGGMGIVYLAFDTSLRRKVALKVLSDAARVASRSLHREAVLTANLSHAGIVPIHYIDKADPPRYYVMEYVQGRSLAEIVQSDGPLAPSLAISVAVQVTEALAAAHERGIIHRDIKPSNIILQQPGNVARLVDFGVSQDTTGALVTLTGSSSTAGTIAFMSPEQNLGQAVDASSDIFSLGMTLYYLLSGQHAYHARTHAELALAFRDQSPIRLSQHNPSVSAGLASIVARCISTDKTKRYSSCKELLADIRCCTSRSVKASRRIWHAAASVALMAIAASAFLWMTSVNPVAKPVAGSAGRGLFVRSTSPGILKYGDKEYRIGPNWSSPALSFVAAGHGCSFYPDPPWEKGLRVRPRVPIPVGSDILHPEHRGVLIAIRKRTVDNNEIEECRLDWSEDEAEWIQKDLLCPAVPSTTAETVSVDLGCITGATNALLYVPHASKLTETGMGVWAPDPRLGESTRRRHGELTALCDALRKLQERITGMHISTRATTSSATGRIVSFFAVELYGIGLCSNCVITDYRTDSDNIEISLEVPDRKQRVTFNIREFVIPNYSLLMDDGSIAEVIMSRLRKAGVTISEFRQHSDEAMVEVTLTISGGQCVYYRDREDK